jgi:hypothetical protein
MMHDWTFKGVSVDWGEATAELEFSSASGPKVVRAKGLWDMHLPRKLPWGPSVSVNRCNEPAQIEGGDYSLVIEMQSGDKIELVAQQFEMPSS